MLFHSRGCRLADWILLHVKMTSTVETPRAAGSDDLQGFTWACGFLHVHMQASGLSFASVNIGQTTVRFMTAGNEETTDDMMFLGDGSLVKIGSSPFARLARPTFLDHQFVVLAVFH
jgi:hypothetical protein